jgi:hypothetical protein
MKDSLVEVIEVHIGTDARLKTEDVLIGVGAATAMVGTIGVMAGTVVLLTAIATGGALVSAGAVTHHYIDEIEGFWAEPFTSDATKLLAE